MLMRSPPDPTLFLGTSGPWDAEIVLVGEAYGFEESVQQKPFVGASGYTLNNMLQDAGLSRSAILCTNIVNDRPPGNDLTKWFEPDGRVAAIGGLYPGARVVAGLKNLRSQLDAHPRRLIIAAGNYPLWALTLHSTPRPKSGIRIPTGIGNWRGSMVYALSNRLEGNGAISAVPVLPIIHPAAILREWTQRAYTVHDLKLRVKQALRGDWRPPTPPITLAPPSFDQAVTKLKEWVWKLNGANLHLAVDIETVKRTFISCIGLADSPHFAMSIPFLHPDGSTYWTPEQELELIQLLGSLLTHPNLTIIGQNFLYDIQYLLDHWGIEPCDLHDTMLFHHLKFPGEPKDLSHLSSLYCQYHWYWKDDSKEWQSKGNLSQHLEYNCIDALRTYEIGMKQMNLLTPLSLHSKWSKEKEKNSLALRMMKRGVLIDKDKRRDIGKDLSKAISRVREQLSQVMPASLLDNGDGKGKKAEWYASPTQQMKIFYEKLGLKPVLHRKTKRPTINEEAFNTLSKRYPELTNIFALIGFLRSLRIFQDTVSSPIDPDDRARCMINTGGTETFRWSTGINAFDRGFNMQNISTGDEHMGWDPFGDVIPPNLREMFVPDPGYIMIEGDLEGADAQIVAWEADDADLKEAFRKRIDVHAMNAEDMWGLAFTRLSGRERQQKRQENKKAVHLTNYGGTDRAIAMALGWTVHEGSKFQSRWFGRHPGIKIWHQRTHQSLQQTNSVSNAYGYSRIYFDRPSASFTEALAWVPQSSVAIACFDGILKLLSQFPQVEPLMSVHDSNLFQIPVNNRPSDEQLVEGLTTLTPYPDPLTIPWKLKKSTISWGDCK